MPHFTDQTGRRFSLPQIPKRIVSLVPSQTELLHYLGLDQEVVGITKFCVHPAAWLSSKQVVGGTKNINIDLVRSLNPDLIIANKEENIREQVTTLGEEVPTYVSDVNDLPGALQMISDTGALTDKISEAALLNAAITTAFEQAAPDTTPIEAAYLIWRKPYMTVGGDTFIHQMLQQAGFRNVFANKQRYPVVLPADLEASGCKVVLLSSEPYPFQQKHIAELQELLPGVLLYLVDGEMFSWYGSRLLQAPRYFSSLRRQLYQENPPLI